jgi:glycosyltransferase 2 family protein
VTIQYLAQRLLITMLLAVLVFAGLALYADLQALRQALTSFNWWMLVPVLVLTVVSLTTRFFKWQYYLRTLGIHDISLANSGAIFLSNYVLILTPGKVGGLLKSYFLKQSNDVPVARSLPIVLAERLTDGVAMVMMTAVALALYPAAWPVVAVVLLAMVLVVGVVQTRPLALWLLAQGQRVPLVRRFTPTMHQLYQSAWELFRLPPLLIGIVLGTLARSAEGVALYFVLLGLSVTSSGLLLEQSIFIAALSNIIGVLVMMPGSLGGTEGSMTGLLDYFAGLAPGPATAVTLLARFGSLWIPALLGLVALFAKRRLFFAPA